MKLSELKTGESGVIVKVSGHGGFRKRVIEMGFIKGKKVDVLLNAPLQDPVKYKIMGYEVSLRHSEADHIEVVSIDEAKNDAKLSKAEEEDRQQVIDSKVVDSNDSDEQALGDKMLVAERKDNATKPWLNRKQKDSTASSTWHWWEIQTAVRLPSSTSHRVLTNVLEIIVA
jgi:ferrous iron transport protein B